MKNNGLEALQIMFKKQRGLQERLGFFPEKMTPQERTSYMKEHIWYMVTELDEAFREMPYGKPWKKYDNFDMELHAENLKEELVDVFHFFMNVMMAAGMEAEDLFEIYCKKNAINHDRQDNNYGADEK